MLVVLGVSVHFAKSPVIKIVDFEGQTILKIPKHHFGVVRILIEQPEGVYDLIKVFTQLTSKH